jgi:hypothetical protein
MENAYRRRLAWHAHISREREPIADFDCQHGRVAYAGPHTWCMECCEISSLDVSLETECTSISLTFRAWRSALWSYRAFEYQILALKRFMKRPMSPELALMTSRWLALFQVVQCRVATLRPCICCSGRTNGEVDRDIVRVLQHARSAACLRDMFPRV